MWFNNTRWPILKTAFQCIIIRFFVLFHLKGVKVNVTAVSPLQKPTFLFDTSPLLTLATPIIDKQPAIEHILPYIQIVLVETVANEATINPRYRDAMVIQALLDAGTIVSHPAPTTSADQFIDAYNLGTTKGRGERDTIRLALTISARPIIDDQGAFFIAARFETQPIMLLDVIVELTRSSNLTTPSAHKMINGIAQTGRYTPAAIQHTFLDVTQLRRE